MDGLIRFFGAYHAADRGQIAVVLEYMDGGSLADVVQKVGRLMGGQEGGSGSRQPGRCSNVLPTAAAGSCSLAAGCGKRSQLLHVGAILSAIPLPCSG